MYANRADLSGKEGAADALHCGFEGGHGVFGDISNNDCAACGDLVADIVGELDEVVPVTEIGGASDKRPSGRQDGRRNRTGRRSSERADQSRYGGPAMTLFGDFLN